MSRAVTTGFGCCGGLVLLLLCIPLLLFAAADGTGSSPLPTAGAEAVTLAGHAELVPARGASCNAAVRCQTIPAEITYVPSGFFPDVFTNPPGECTSWAAALWPGHRGRGVTWSGDAWEWYGNAAAQGYTVATTPSLGAIVVFERSQSDAGAWGHVALVTAVAANSFQITEMNEVGRFRVDERAVAFPTAGIAGFIPVPSDGLA